MSIVTHEQLREALKNLNFFEVKVSKIDYDCLVNCELTVAVKFDEAEPQQVKVTSECPVTHKFTSVNLLNSKALAFVKSQVSL